MNIRKARLSIECFIRLQGLRMLAKRKSSESNNIQSAHLALLPPHPENPFGSRGDQAMAFAAISEFKSIYPTGQVSIITSKGCTELSSITDINYIPIWGRQGITGRGLKSLAHATHFAAIGADVMDGYYWPPTVLRALNLCERVRIQGIHTGILGFSFNATPNRHCVNALQLLNPKIRLFCRDPVSFDRFSGIVGEKAKLSADSAFCLRPRTSEDVKDVAHWTNSQKLANRKIIGFNLHLLLLKAEISCDESEVIKISAKTLSKLIIESNVSILLIPHDFRESKNDKTMLSQVLEYIPEEIRQFVLLPKTEFMADELKAIAGLCDLVLTGRMHLAIATLGMGVPVGVIAYQDKFEGLIKHFDMDDSVILQPKKLDQFESVWNWMNTVFQDRVELNKKTQNMLPKVLELSQSNFAWMIENEKTLIR
jgi:polysaccharide pyruvyl transferase WcaK-like protein